jgi:glycosyltransferase involved in cell wall biosynthesis
LATIEAGGCNLPVLTTNIGALYNIPSGIWGIKVENNDYIGGIKYINNNRGIFSPRKYFLNNKFDKSSCRDAWLSIVEGLI